MTEAKDMLIVVQLVWRQKNDKSVAEDAGYDNTW